MTKPSVKHTILYAYTLSNNEEIVKIIELLGKMSVGVRNG